MKTYYESETPLIDFAYARLEKLSQKGIHFCITDENGTHCFRLQEEIPFANPSRQNVYECWTKGFSEGVDMIWNKAKEIYGDFEKEKTNAT